MARSFNGTSEKITGPTIASGSLPQTNCTISAWIYPTAFTNTYNCIAQLNPNFSEDIQFFVKSTGKMAWYIGISGSNNSPNIDPGTGTLTTNTWNHVCMRSAPTNGAGMNTDPYLNGVTDGTATNNNAGSTFVAFSHNTLLAIGFDNNTAGRWFPGRIADLALWNVSLTVAEIQALNNGARPYTIRPFSLVFWLPLDGLQSPEPDLGAQAFNGTLTGTALAAGPPVMQFTPRWPRNIIAPAAAASSFQPAWTMNKNFINEGIGF